MSRRADQSWYVLKNDQQIGPIPETTFRQSIEEGLIRKTDLIWRRGLSTWTAAEELLQFGEDKSSRLKPPPLPKHAFLSPKIAEELAPPPLPKKFALSNREEDRRSIETGRALVPAELSAQSASKSPSCEGSGYGASTTTTKNAGYLAQHWSGQLSLPISYWFNGFLGYLIATFAVTAIGASSLLTTDFSPSISLLSMVGVWGTTFVVLSWQVVGTWRAATRYKSSNGKSLWSIAAKVSLCIAIFSTLAQFVNHVAPQIREMYGIYEGDEKGEAYAFRILRDGAELEFSGGIKFGAAKEFTRFIDAMGALKIIHLNSQGGRIEEAQRIGDIIKKRNLDTYVANSCLSACTVIFLSGKNRFITKSAKIGFHQPNFPGLTTEDRILLARREEGRLQRFGLSARFAKRVNEVAPEDMWIPGAAELISEGVATRIVDGSAFALSGINSTDITLEKSDRLLRGIPIYASIERMDMPTYQKILGIFFGGLRRENQLAR